MKNHGGKRDGAGPPIIPIGERKQQVSVYLEKDFIDEAGGVKKVQEDLKDHFYRNMKETNEKV